MFFCQRARLDPKNDGGLFILANSDESSPFELVKSACEETLAGEATASLPKLIDAKLVDELLGTYRDSRGRTLTVRREGALVAASIDWNGPKTVGYLNPSKNEKLSYDSMISPKPARFKRMNIISVTRDGAGKVTGLTISDLDPSLTFDRVAQ